MTRLYECPTCVSLGYLCVRHRTNRTPDPQSADFDGGPAMSTGGPAPASGPQVHREADASDPPYEPPSVHHRRRTRMTIINATEAELAAVFEEWLRRYNEEPERFTEEYGEPEEYGAGCANYFIRLHNEITEADS